MIFPDPPETTIHSSRGFGVSVGFRARSRRLISRSTAPKYFRPPDAAAFLREHHGFGATRSLAKLRVMGGGPTYRKAGRLVLYSEGDRSPGRKPRSASLASLPLTRRLSEMAPCTCFFNPRSCHRIRSRIPVIQTQGAPFSISSAVFFCSLLRLA